MAVIIDFLLYKERRAEMQAAQASANAIGFKISILWFGAFPLLYFTPEDSTEKK